MSESDTPPSESKSPVPSGQSAAVRFWMIERFLAAMHGINLRAVRFWHWSAKWNWFAILFSAGIGGMYKLGEFVASILLMSLAAFGVISKILHSAGMEGASATERRGIKAFGIVLVSGLLIYMVALTTLNATKEKTWSNLPTLLVYIKSKKLPGGESTNPGKGAMVVWRTPDAIDFGVPLSDKQLNAVASIPGSFVYNPTFGSTLPSGTNTLSATFYPSDRVRYSEATKTVALVVVAKRPTSARMPDALTDRPSISITNPVIRGNAFTGTITNVGSMAAIDFRTLVMFETADWTLRVLPSRDDYDPPPIQPGTISNLVVSGENEPYKYVVICNSYLDAPASKVHNRYAQCFYYRATNPPGGDAVEVVGAEKAGVREHIKAQVLAFEIPKQRIVPEPGPFDEFDDKRLFEWGKSMLIRLEKIHEDYKIRARRTRGDALTESDRKSLNVTEHMSLNDCCKQLGAYRSAAVKTINGGCPIHQNESSYKKVFDLGPSWMISIDPDLENIIRDLSLLQDCMKEKVEMAK
jgi:hypothetical protein